MNEFGIYWNMLLVNPIINLLVALYKLFEFIHIPGPLGWAIILLTVVIRLLLYPLMHAQMKSARKMANLKPHLDVINAKHKNDKTALQQAQLALYKEHGVNPAAGCLPILVQMPVLIALYNVFYQVLNNGNMEKLLVDVNAILYPWIPKLTSFDLTFFGINLGIKPSAWQQAGWWLLSIPLITGLLQWWQTRLMQPAVANPKNPTNITNPTNEKPKQKEEKPQDTAGEMQKQMAIMTPIMFGFFAFQFPLGLSLYWNVFGLFGIMQQLSVNRQNNPIIQ